MVICIPPAIPASEQQLQCLYASQQQKLKIIACKHCSQNNKILIRDKNLFLDVPGPAGRLGPTMATRSAVPPEVCSCTAGDVRLHASNGKCVACGGNANASELRDMSGCGWTCCGAEATAGLVYGRTTRSCCVVAGGADASVPRRACDCGGAAAASGNAVARRMQVCGGEWRSAPPLATVRWLQAASRRLQGCG